MFAIRQRLENYLQPWFKRRAPVSRDITLNLRNVYIFLSKEGLLYAFLLIILFVAGINYANNLVLGLCFLLGSLLVVTIHYTFAHLAGLQIKLVDISDTQVGDKVQVLGILDGQGGHIRGLLHQIHADTAGIVLPQRPLHLGVTGVTYHDHLLSLATGAMNFHMHLGHQGAGGIIDAQTPLLGLFPHRLGDTVGRKDDDLLIRHFAQLFDEDGAGLP